MRSQKKESVAGDSSLALRLTRVGWHLTLFGISRRAAVSPGLRQGLYRVIGTRYEIAKKQTRQEMQALPRVFVWKRDDRKEIAVSCSKDSVFEQFSVRTI
jgi:hypothetical protein